MCTNAHFFGHSVLVAATGNFQANLKKWGDWQKLVKTTDFLVFPRKEFKNNLKKYSLSKPEYRFKLIKNKLLKTNSISSTKIRQRIKKGLAISNLVPKKVEDYIIKHKLFLG